MDINEKLEKAKSKKYYKWEFFYERHNPQLGVHTHSSTVIAATEAEAIRLAKKYCDGGCYGYNYFDHLGEKKLLEYGKDYILKIEQEYNESTDRYYAPKVVAEKVYH